MAGALLANPTMDRYAQQGGYAEWFIVDPAIPSIRIKPYLDVVSAGNKSQWFALRTALFSGKKPKFLLEKSTIWFGLDVNMWIGAWAISADTDTWYQFDNVAVGAADYEFSHNTSFPGGSIYVALWPMYPLSRTQRLVTSWSLSGLVSDTVSSVGKVISLSTALATDGMRKTPVGLPYCAFKIANATPNVKNNVVLTARMHACEGMGGWAFEGAVDWLLLTSPEQKFLLDWSNVLCYPNIYPQNTWAGHSRMIWEDSSIDPNQVWDTIGTYEFIDVFKASPTVDSGGTIDAGIDFHAYGSSGNPFGDVEDDASAMNVAFKAEMVKLQATYTLLEEALPHSQPHWWNTGLAASLYVTQEMPIKKALGVADWKTFGSNTLKSVTNLLAAGRFTSGPGVGSRKYDAVGDSIVFPNIYSVAAASDITISLWLYATVHNQNKILFGISNAAGTRGLYVWNATTGRDISYTVEGVTGQFRRSSAAVWAYSVWNHVLITHNGGALAANIHIYTNGLETGYAGAADGAGMFYPFDGSFIVGNYYALNAAPAANIAQAAAWNSILSPANIALLGSSVAYAPNLITPAPNFYLKGNTADLHDVITNALGVDTTTTQLTGVGNGPSIIYP
jgi:hypothetical protein